MRSMFAALTNTISRVWFLLTWLRTRGRIHETFFSL